MRRLQCLVVTVAACGGPGGPDVPDDQFDRNAMLDHLARQVLLPKQTEAAARANELPVAIDAHCDALEAGTPGDTLATARTAWAATIDAWQRTEALLVGPADDNDKQLRSLIYAWPTTATCDIDREIVELFANPAAYDVTTKFVRTRSLLAVEYLLHAPTTNHTCTTTPAGYDALGANVPIARCRLAEAIAVDVAAQTTTLVTAWQTYVDELAGAGQGSSSIATAQAGANLISDAFFYVDRMVKDMKLGEPTGIAMTGACGGGTICPIEVELTFSDRASVAIRQNLVSLREGFTGATAAGDGLGFDDFLIAVGHPDVASRMVGNLDAAIAAANAMPDSFLTALASDPELAKLASTHAAVKAFTDDLKSQFLTLLALEIPDDVAMDND